MRAQAKRIKDACVTVGAVVAVWTALGLFAMRHGPRSATQRSAGWP